MIAPAKYLSSPTIREAIRLDWGPHTGHTADEMLAFLREWAIESDPRWDPYTHDLCYEGAESSQSAEPGSWMLLHPTGYLYHLSHEQFTESFDKAES